MAKNLNKTSSFNVGVIVSNAISAVREVRSQENSRKEAEFQKAVAAGMTYADQVKFREEQLADEKAGGFPDNDYIMGLEKAVADTKQLSRFEKIRTKYKESLDSYITGKKSIDSYINLLQDTLSTEKDETLRNEIRGLISTATQEKATNELNAIKNRALVAQKDNSVKLVDKSISEIKSRRARASINENDDEVAMWDETLLALEGSKAKLQIENSMNEISFKINKFNSKANDKLGYLNDEIATADDNKEIVYNGVTYPSVKSFWENKRNEYIATGYFDEAKKDMDAETARIAATSKFGQIPTVRIQAVNDYYNTLKARPEFAPYVNVIEQKRVEALSNMTSDLAESIFNEEATTGDRAKAENAILGLENRFGVAVSREPFARELNGGSSIASNAGGRSDTTVTPPTPTVTPTAPVAPTAGNELGSYVVAAGDNLSRIASKNGISLLQLLDANPEYKANPAMVRTGATIKLPAVVTPPVSVTPPVAPTPVVTPVVPVTPPQTSTTTPPAVTKPIAPTPVTAPVAPVVTPPTPTQRYSGTSIVDFLSSRGENSSFGNRRTLAEQNGIMNYTGSAQQNLELLGKLNK